MSRRRPLSSRPHRRPERRQGRRWLIPALLLLGAGLAVGGVMVACRSGVSTAPAVAADGRPGDAAGGQTGPAPAPGRVAIPGWTLLRGDDRPLAPLRGYGALAGESARYAPAPGREASYLRITAPDATRAQVVLAKYRSDLRSLGGVAEATVAVGGRDLAALQVPGQGRILAAAAGSEVVILAAADAGDLATLAGPVLAPLGAAVCTAPSATVPMYLDAWDRHGFRFYYRPWETPKGTAWKDYDVLKEFDFAKCEDVGLVAWAGPSEIDTQAGGTNRAWWGFAIDALRRRGQPWVLNISNSYPTWLLNRHPGDRQTPMPQFSGGSHGVAKGWCAASRALSWSSMTAKDEQLAGLQAQVREHRGDPLLLEYLEPHGELCHGQHDVFLEYGPLADRTFRDHLKARYGTIEALARRWEMPLGSWDAVRVPEVAGFLGWGPQALDLAGAWRIAHEPEPSADAPRPKPYQRKPVRAPAEWLAADFDDAGWPQLTAPGDDLAMHLPHKPAVMRRSFEVAADWLAAGPRTWLYLWDLNGGEHLADVVSAHLNGRQVGEDLTRHATPHWAAWEVTGVLAAGRNQLALRLPEGMLGYRVYLSHHEPVQYPALGAGGNARWVDFTDWRIATRIEAVRRGMAMIRGADAERPIINMAPDSYFAQVKELCEDYGGRFHNTGHMGGFWNDYLPMLMRGSDLPFSLEPGGPATDLPGFKHMMGLWFTEGVQAVHYFIHIGDVLWPEAIRAHFERIRPLIGSIGKIHPPKAGVAMLFSDRVNQFSGFPWRGDYNLRLPSGYWGWRFSDHLGADHHIDAVTDRDFARGNAARYPVIVDSNTTVMDDELVGRIEQYVRQGGTFVTLIQTGRHTPETPDSWPIARLTGYKVVGIDPHTPDGEAARYRRFRVLDESMFHAADWPQQRQGHWNGLSLERVAPECQDLLRWEDGTVAAGLRRIGKGAVVHLGLKAGSGRGGGSGEMVRMIEDVLAWAKVPRLPAAADGVMLRHSVANNGLWDAWTLWNNDRQKTVATALRFADGARPRTCLDLLTGRELIPVATATGARLDGLTIEPLETRIYLTPRDRIAEAPLAWFDLQRAWWRAAKAPERPLPEPRHDDQALDLTEGWAYRMLGESDTADQSPLAAPAMDDAGWPRRRMAPWAVPEELPSRHVLFRRAFTVPASWGRGRTTLWLKSWFHWTVAGTARFWLDGKEVAGGDGRGGLILDLDPAAGGRHVLAVEIRGEGTVCGVRGGCWLSFVPEPAVRIDLAGTWSTTSDLLREGAPVDLPGRVEAVRSLRRTVAVPAAWAGKPVWIHIDAGSGINDILVNGHYYRRHHHGLGTATDLDITPWVRPGEDNRIELLTGGRMAITAVDLRLR